VVSSIGLLWMVVRNITFPCMLVYELQARRGWTMGGRLVATYVNLMVEKVVRKGVRLS